MKVRTFDIRTRYTYDEGLTTTHNTPLYDNKTARPIPPTATVRVNGQYLTPKQIVYILHHAPAPTTSDTDPPLALPPYILNVDGNPHNIRIDNLRASLTSRRWGDRCKDVEVNNIIIPRDLLALMTEDDLARFGITRNDLQE